MAQKASEGCGRNRKKKSLEMKTNTTRDGCVVGKLSSLCRTSGDGRTQANANQGGLAVGCAWLGWG